MCRGLVRADGMRPGRLLAIGRAMYVIRGGRYGTGDAFVRGV